MLLTDREAVTFMRLANKYVADSVNEGMTADEVGDLTLRMILNDLIGSLPSHHTVELPDQVRIITGD